MRLLLDSHVVLWLATGDPILPPAAIDRLLDNGNDLLVSAASIWELEIKRARGRLSAPLDLLDRMEDAGFHLLAITPDQAMDAARLPPHHRDPFDRILVAQAQSEAAVLVTHDETLQAYDVPVMRVGG